MKKIVSNIKPKRSKDNGAESTLTISGIEPNGLGYAISREASTGRLKLRYVLKTPERRRDQLQLQSLVLPAFVVLVIFSYLPLWGVLMAFQNFSVYKGFWHSDWVGFKQFRDFFLAPEFGKIMRNTIVISFLKLLLGFPAPIVLALILTEIKNRTFKRLAQTVTYLPHFLSWVIVSGMVLSMFAVRNGSVNMLLQTLGIIKKPIAWMSQPQYFWGILVSANIWKEVGFGSIIYLAAIAGINPELYEAASVDGAGRMQKIVRITLPSIAPQIIVLLILRISHILNAGFQDILLLTNNGTNVILRDVSDVIATYVYRVGLQNQRFSYATAAGLAMSVVNIIMLWSANAFSRRLSETSLW